VSNRPASGPSANASSNLNRQAKKKLAQREREAQAQLALQQRKQQRNVSLIRAGVLIVVGVAIAFTATSHENLEVNRWMFGVAFLLIGVATLIEFTVKRSEPYAWTVATRAAVAVVAGMLALLAPDHLFIAYTISGWGVLNGLLVISPGLTDADRRKTLMPAAFLSLALAVLVFLNHSDSVAVIGFFGAYAVISGIFLAIAAFDPRGREADADPAVTSKSRGK